MPTTTKKPSSLRAALKKRITHETEYRIPLVPLEEARLIQSELQQARQIAQAGEFLKAKDKGAGKSSTDEAEQAIRAAEAAAEKLQEKLDACFYIIRFRPLPSEDFDALVQLHPPSAEQLEEAQEKREELPLWNESTFYPELLERCAFNSELSAAEWADELKGWTRAERKEVQARALEANVRSYSTALSFG